MKEDVDPAGNTTPKTCPECRHAFHGDRVCLNMASDNDCSCSGVPDGDAVTECPRCGKPLAGVMVTGGGWSNETTYEAHPCKHMLTSEEYDEFVRVRDAAPSAVTEALGLSERRATWHLLTTIGKVLDNWSETSPGSPERNSLWRVLHDEADVVRDLLGDPMAAAPAPTRQDAEAARDAVWSALVDLVVESGPLGAPMALSGFMHSDDLYRIADAALSAAPSAPSAVTEAQPVARSDERRSLSDVLDIALSVFTSTDDRPRMRVEGEFDVVRKRIIDVLVDHDVRPARPAAPDTTVQSKDGA